MSFRLTPTLASVLAAFVLLTAMSILALSTHTSQRVTSQLGSQLVDLGMDAFDLQFQAGMAEVREQANYVASALRGGAINPDDDTALTGFIHGVLASTPQVISIAVIRPSTRIISVERGEGGGSFGLRPIRHDPDPDTLELLTKAEAKKGAFWTEPAFAEANQRTEISYVVPSYSGERFLGLAVVKVSLNGLSALARTLSSAEMTMFLFYGNRELLAHPQLDPANQNVSEDNDLVDLIDAPGPVLARLPEMVPVDPSQFNLVEAHAMYRATGTDAAAYFIVLERSAADATGLPVQVGAYFPVEVLEAPMAQLSMAAMLGLAILGLALVGSALLAIYIGRPVRRAARSANSVAKLQLDSLVPLPDSRIVEIRELGQGFNRMVTALRAFLRYMPQSLVRRLIESGSIDQPPAERNVAVLFTDIVGFTHVSEGLSAAETAAFINAHLTLVGEAVERNGGTIDKYIGDSVMAFWGAPEELEHPAAAAAQAALDIARAIKLDNRRREGEGLPPVRLRIGLHVGPLVVGDIGAPQRVNYTVIGDTVNIASRLETLGRDIDPDAETIILASAQVASELPPTCPFAPLGSHRIKGKDMPVDVVRLLPPRMGPV